MKNEDSFDGPQTEWSTDLPLPGGEDDPERRLRGFLTETDVKFLRDDLEPSDPAERRRKLYQRGRSAVMDFTLLHECLTDTHLDFIFFPERDGRAKRALMEDEATWLRRGMIDMLAVLHRVTLDTDAATESVQPDTFEWLNERGQYRASREYRSVGDVRALVERGQPEELTEAEKDWYLRALANGTLDDLDDDAAWFPTTTPGTATDARDPEADSAYQNLTGKGTFDVADHIYVAPEEAEFYDPEKDDDQEHEDDA
ncbi:hypothetical protein [Haladaptatus salinisoli]|uniref:hypothetical protein n=1 Tax=Haladaptatus salinisoli TaxID=2884876 RepID=UPI001D0A8E05|nr:hypothetical protein [Haladaptatus salinisoli]